MSLKFLNVMDGGIKHRDNLYFSIYNSCFFPHCGYLYCIYRFSFSKVCPYLDFIILHCRLCFTCFKILYFSNSNTFESFVVKGYAYILTHPGIPTVFYDHFFDWGSSIQNEIIKLVSNKSSRVTKHLENLIGMQVYWVMLKISLKSHG
jgi:hypothetical protein